MPTGDGVEVLFFARLRDAAGVRSEHVAIRARATAHDLWVELGRRHPALARSEADRPDLRVAVNRAYATWDTVLRDGDEVAFLPPVSGGSVDTGARILVRVDAAVIDPRELEDFVRGPADGAICSFSGVVRDHTGDRSVIHLEYEAYAEMAAAEIERIAREVLDATGAHAIALVHRLGRLAVGETSVVVSAAAAHRAEAFAACRLGIDELKARAPIWKREHGPEGASWVDPI